MSEHDELTDRIENLVHSASVPGANFGMKWTRWNSRNQAEHIISLVRADEREQLRESLLNDAVIDEMAKAIAKAEGVIWDWNEDCRGARSKFRNIARAAIISALTVVELIAEEQS